MNRRYALACGAFVAGMASMWVIQEVHTMDAASLLKPLPEPVIVSVYLPPRAEVLPRQQVHPGTFKIEVEADTLPQLPDLGGERPIVTYGLGDGEGNDVLSVEYWIPRGETTFYHSIDLPRMPTLPGLGFAYTHARYISNGQFEIATVHDRSEYLIMATLGVGAIWMVYCFVWWVTSPARVEECDGI